MIPMNEIMMLLSSAIMAEDGTVTAELATDKDTTATVTVDSTPADGAAGGTVAPPKKPFNPGSILLLVGMFVLMYFILFRGPRKQQREQAQMRNSIQKNDRIVTIGGIYGTVIDIKDDEMTIKVDESNNTKIKVAKSAISRKV